MSSYYPTIRQLAGSLSNSSHSSCFNRYGLTLYHASVSHVEIGAGGELFGTVVELQSALVFSTAGSQEDGLLGIYSILETYTFREGIEKHIVLFTDEVSLTLLLYIASLVTTKVYPRLELNKFEILSA